MAYVLIVYYSPYPHSLKSTDFLLIKVHLMPHCPYPLNTVRKMLKFTEVPQQPQGSTEGMGQRWDLNFRLHSSGFLTASLSPWAPLQKWRGTVIPAHVVPGLLSLFWSSTLPFLSHWLHPTREREMYS